MEIGSSRGARAQAEIASAIHSIMVVAILCAALLTPSWLLKVAPTSRACVRCATGNADPFRPTRPPLEPMVINAIQDLLGSGGTAASVAESALKVRAHNR